MYIKFIDNNPVEYTIAQLRQDNPQVSFPANPTEACLAEWNIFPLKLVPRPNVDYTKSVSAAMPVQIEGTWTQTWDIRDVTDTELQERYLEAALQVRQERDALLTQSDWTQITDATVDKTAWLIYRQALRDVTAQPAFPTVVNWPLKPE